MLIVRHFLFKGLPCLVEATEVDEGKRFDGAILDRRDAEPAGPRRGAIAAGDAVHQLGGAPVGPPPIEHMLVFADHVPPPPPPPPHPPHALPPRPNPFPP